MYVENVEEIENFWIGVVEGSVNAGKAVTCVPVDGLSRQTAAKLATKLHIMVLIKGTDYLFTASLQELLQDERGLH